MPKCGTRGQNGHRPKMTSRAGSSVSIDSSAHSTPMAATGPSARLDSTSEASRQSSPSATVVADATIAGLALCSASAMASWRSS